MLRRLVSLLIAFPLGIILVAIAIANRHPVSLVLDPFNPETPALAVSLPFYAYLIGALVVGVMLGGTATWVGQSRWRRTARIQGQRAQRYEAEAERLTRERESDVTRSKQIALAGR